MNQVRHSDFVVSEYGRSMFEALFSLSQTQRRLAHRAKREALEAEEHGQLNRYQFMRTESDRLWRDAKWHFNRSRMAKEGRI